MDAFSAPSSPAPGNPPPSREGPPEKNAEVARYVRKTRKLPECRGELVEHFREQIKAGCYPPADVAEALALRLLPRKDA